MTTATNDCPACGRPYQRIDARTVQVTAPIHGWRYVPWILEWYECGGSDPECVPRLSQRRGTLEAEDTGDEASDGGMALVKDAFR